MRFPVQRHNEAFIEFLGEKCDQAKDPLIVRTTVREYRSRGSDRTEESLVHCAYRYKLKVREIADEKKRARQLFALSVPVDEELMGKLEKHARVVLDKNNLITEYCSHDGSLILKGDQSQSNRMKNALAEFRKARETNIDNTEKEDNLPGLNPPVPKKPRVTEPWNNLGSSPAGSYTPQASQLTGSRYSSSQAPCALVQQGSLRHVRQFGRTQNTFGVSSGTPQTSRNPFVLLLPEEPALEDVPISNEKNTSRNQFVAPGQLRFAVRATPAQTPPKEKMPPLVDNQFEGPTANIKQEIPENPSLEVVPIRNGRLGISADNRPGQGQPTAQTIKATCAPIQQGSACHARQFGRTQNTFGVSSGTPQTSRNQRVLLLPEEPALEDVPISNENMDNSADNRPGPGQLTAQTINGPESDCRMRQFGRAHNTCEVRSGTPQATKNQSLAPGNLRFAVGFTQTQAALQKNMAPIKETEARASIKQVIPEKPALKVVPISNENMDDSADNRPGQGKLTTQIINAPKSVCQSRQFGRTYNTSEFRSGTLQVSKNQSVTTAQSKSAATTTQAPSAPERNMGLIKAVQVKANIEQNTPKEPTFEVDPKNGDLEIIAVVKPERHNHQEQRPQKNEPPRRETLTLATQKKLLESISTLIQVMELPFDFQNLEKKIQLITGYGRSENDGRPELKKVELRKLLIALEYSFIKLQEDSENVKNEKVRSLKMYLNHLLFVMINVRMPGFDSIKTQVKELLDEIKDADVMIPVSKILASMRIFIDTLLPKYVSTAINQHL
ncbi:hypothetical protein CAEBREN_02569 [Caenorhabditis brenneri]|uniref:SPK domain-containing protein n=1 Tax=Caenorhabditis brenneri TaxID=135651 RepID=G0MY97_CAEBE|nr:hypothetical protein CAEBREN_02569 [Caenorhabditis brenneri]